MTILGPDISSFQAGLNVRALTDPFVLMKCTEDVGYMDADYPGWLAQAKATGKLVVAYHFIGPSSPAAQAAHLAAHIIDRTIPVMVDFEDEGSFRPTLAQLLALNDAIAAAGLRVKLNYVPRWKWSELGSPSLAPIAARGIGVVSSAYPGGSGYPGDGGSGWQPYGGITPLLWQYTDAAYEGGQTVGDMNAYRGTAQQLAAFLGAPSSSSTSTSQGGTVGTIPPSISQKWPELAGDFPPNAAFTDESALIWADGGARAAALYAQQARDAINALAARTAAPQIDVQTLAAALGPLLHPTTDIDALTAALLPHLPGAPDPTAFAQALLSHIKVD